MHRDSFAYAPAPPFQAYEIDTRRGDLHNVSIACIFEPVFRVCASTNSQTARFITLLGPFSRTKMFILCIPRLRRATRCPNRASRIAFAFSSNGASQSRAAQRALFEPSMRSAVVVARIELLASGSSAKCIDFGWSRDRSARAATMERIKEMEERNCVSKKIPIERHTASRRIGALRCDSAEARLLLFSTFSIPIFFGIRFADGSRCVTLNC